MENETDKNINDLLAMTDFSMNKLFGEPKKEIESPEQFADRIFRQSGLAEKFDQLDLQIKNINNTLGEVLTDCHQNDRTAPNSGGMAKEAGDYRPKGDSSANTKICHMCGMPGATVNQSGNYKVIWTHEGMCSEKFEINEEKATQGF